MKTAPYEKAKAFRLGVERFTSARVSELVAEVGEKYLSRQPREKPKGLDRSERVARCGRSSLGQEGDFRGERRGCEAESAQLSRKREEGLTRTKIRGSIR